MNFFKKQKKKVVAVPQEKTIYPEIVNRIHREFNTAGDAALAEAKQILSQSTVENERKAKLLANMGFTSTKECKDFAEKDKLKVNKQNIAIALEEVSQHYPQYKFLTQKSAEDICKKYNLVIGNVHQYTGFVPEKNLKDIENFYSENNPIGTVYQIVSYGSMWRRAMEIDEEMFYQIAKKQVENPIHSHSYTNKTRRPLKIAAPEKDMNPEGYKLVGRLFVKEDPIVLAPITIKGVDLMCIVTAWGDEASDPQVVNEKNN